MNGRLYDPMLHRFLAPDNYVQDPYNTQNFNRYGYVLNNPLMYVDPSGEIIGTAITAIFEGIKNVVAHGINFDQYSWQQTQNAWDIDRGMVKGNFGQIAAKWTWGLLPNLMGNLVAHGYNISGNVHEVTHLEGATAIGTTRDSGAFALGYYLNGPKGFKADWKDHLFVHEYGHALQSNILGPLYLVYLAPTSLLSAAGVGGDDHLGRWFEVDASKRGATYFDKWYGSGAEGYVEGSVDYFDLNSFVNENTPSPYINPREIHYNRRKGFQTKGTDFNWFDLMPGYLWSKMLLEIF